MAVAMIWFQGHRSARRSRRRRPPRARRAAAVNRRKRRRLGSQRRACPSRASMAIQAGARWPSRRSRPRSGSGRSPGAGSSAGRCLSRSGCGPRSGPGGGPQFEVVELAAFRAGGEAGDAVAVDVGEPQLRARVRAFLADDDPHALRPAGQAEHAGDLGDPGAVAGLAVAVIGRRPGRRRPGQRPGPFPRRRPRGPDRPQRPDRVSGPALPPAATPPDRTPPGRTAPAQRAAPRHRPGSPAQRHRDHQVTDDLPRVMNRPPPAPPGQTCRQPGRQAGHPKSLGGQQPARAPGRLPSRQRTRSASDDAER